MISKYPRINYSELNSRQKEHYNFQKISAVFAEFGFSTIRLTDDWNGADFLAIHKDGETLKVQLKGRVTICGKYMNKDIWVAAPYGKGWYVYPHDEAMEIIDRVAPFRHSQSWILNQIYSWKAPSKLLHEALQPYYIEGDLSAGKVYESDEDSSTL